MSALRVACLGMGWWSDVLADAIKGSGKMQIAACYSRSADKREAFAKKYGCRAARQPYFAANFCRFSSERL